ncbi:hypothetical protein WJU23_03390 [Prosthecobacter sp. SYSU 5D2]|uniref:hypothetical protein n=1 Tax=Prosthecobacter sp. SYSU 5D2 TaxID=3134134 RepID=UPI0031FEAF8A
MKTSRLVLASFLAAAAAAAQSGGTVVTSAPSIEAAINTSSTDLNATLTQLLNEAERQTEKLQTSLDRMGDPAAVNLASVQLIKQDILDSATLLKTEDQQRMMMTGLTGAEVFTDDAFGLMEPIGATVTKDDGTEVERDPEKYRMEAAVMAQIKEFKRVREEALQRKTALTTELGEVIQDLEDAQDLASIQKLNAMITLLRGQIDEINQSILIAQADAEMTQKELVGQAQIMTKAKSEAAMLNRPAPDPATATGTFPGLGTTPRKLPWGRKGSTGNPGGTEEEVP